MQSIINPSQPFSSNPYTTKTQITNHIGYLRDILQYQKSSNEIRYHTRDLINSINHFKSKLSKVEREIRDKEQTRFYFPM